MKTVVGLFDDMAQAKQAALDLENAGITHDAISIVANNEGGKYAPVGADTTTTTDGAGHAIGRDALVGAEIGGAAGLLMAITGFAIPGFGWIAGAGWLMATILGAGTGAVIGGLVGALTSVGVPEEDAAHFNEGVRRGGILLAVKAEDNAAHRVAQILSDDGAVNIDERAEQYKQDGFIPTAAPMAPAASVNTTPAPPIATPPAPAATAQTAQTLNRSGETVIPVVKEQLEVGKREVQGGGVRVYTHVTQQPVQEQVTLHEEHVNVERRPVDRPINPADATAFKDQSFEMTERSEVPVVSKEARVVEEVSIGKQATDRVETVRDNVRQTEVEVQPLSGSEHTSRTRNYDTYAGDFRSDFQSKYASQGRYEEFDPAYRYGYELRSNPSYQGRDWSSIEPEIRRDWETRQPNTWDRFKNSIRFAWDKTTGAERGGIQTGGRSLDGTPDTRGLAEKTADAVTGDRIDDKTGKVV